MEEHVGQAWHRLITRAARHDHPEAAALLDDMRRSAALVLRAGGGPAALQLSEVAQRTHGGPRRWLERIAGSGRRSALASVDDTALALPPVLATALSSADNRDHYLWMAALAAHWSPTGHWLHDNVRAALAACRTFPGLAPAYRRITALVLRERLPVTRGATVPAEQALRAALHWLASDPAAADRGELQAPRDLIASAEANFLAALPPVDDAQALSIAPVATFLYPPPQVVASARPSADAPKAKPPPHAMQTHEDRRRRHAEQTEDDRTHAGMVLPFRAESLLSVAEMVRVNREDDDDPDADPTSAADDLDTLSIARDGQTLASRVRFHLDLPSASGDDLPLQGQAHTLPEWSWREHRLLPDYCSVQVLHPRIDPERVHALSRIPAHLAAAARQVRNRLSTLRAQPHWKRGLPDGDTLDLDAWVRFAGERQAVAQHADDPPVLARRVRGDRSLATLLLADLSLSTEAGLGRGRGDARVIDIIRDALMVFGEALAGAGDTFEILGFSSVRRERVRILQLKSFEEGWNARSRARVGAIRPGYYSRIGAAVREATLRLAERPESTRLLLLLTDGKPTDLDRYEGRWGLEDTRQAVLEARRQGLVAFAITIDQQAHEYLPFLFGRDGWALVRDPAELVTRLSRIYAELTRAEHGA